MLPIRKLRPERGQPANNFDLVLQPNGSSAYFIAKYGTDYRSMALLPGGNAIFPTLGTM